MEFTSQHQGGEWKQPQTASNHVEGPSFVVSGISDFRADKTALLNLHPTKGAGNEGSRGREARLVEEAVVVVVVAVVAPYQIHCHEAKSM